MVVDTYSRRWTSGGTLAARLLRRFEDGELEARSAKGEGSALGGPPTTSRSDGCEGTVVPASLEALELRRSLGGGIGSGDDMTDNDVQDKSN